MGNVKPMKNKGHKRERDYDYAMKKRNKNKKINRMINPYKKNSVESR